MVHVCVNVFDLEARSSSSFVADKGTLSEDTIHIFLQQIGKVHVYSGKIKSSTCKCYMANVMYLCLHELV